MHLVRPGLRLVGLGEADPEAGVLARQQHDALVGVIEQLPPQHTSPEPRQPSRILRIKPQREQFRSHPSTLDVQTPTAHTN